MRVGISDLRAGRGIGRDSYGGGLKKKNPDKKKGADAGENAPSGDAPKPGAPARESEDAPGMENVMASLSKLFGGREFLSDEDLDAFLDSKIASGEIPPSAALDPLDEAQSLVYEAWNSVGPQKVRLARRALELSPLCADAYLILAEEEARDLDTALKHYRQAVAAGEKAMGPAPLNHPQAKLWENMEARPYMRARLGLAECLWDSGSRDEALGHLRELMRLNPSDNQGVRYILVHCFQEMGSEDELGELLERFRNDPSPEIKYTHALWVFRREGSSELAIGLLSEALEANSLVPAYLLKRKKLPKRAPEAAREGSEEEASAYAMGALDPWHKTLGALEWLAEHAPE